MAVERLSYFSRRNVAGEQKGHLIQRRLRKAQFTHPGVDGELLEADIEQNTGLSRIYELLQVILRPIWTAEVDFAFDRLFEGQRSKSTQNAKE